MTINSTDTAYNGWTNYATWSLAQQLNNEEGTYGYWHERALKAYQHASGGPVFTRREQATLDLAKCLKADVDAHVPTTGAGFYTDILNAGLAVIDYNKIAERWIAAVIEAAPKNEDTNVIV